MADEQHCPRGLRQEGPVGRCRAGLSVQSRWARLSACAERQAVFAPVVVAPGTQTQPRAAPLTMVAAQNRAEMPSCPANGCPHAPQRSSASWAVVSAKRSVLVGLGAITLLTCLSSVYLIGGRRGPAMQMVEVDEVWQRVGLVYPASSCAVGRARNTGRGDERIVTRPARTPIWVPEVSVNWVKR
jgi:hypothetical protein